MFSVCGSAWGNSLIICAQLSSNSSFQDAAGGIGPLRCHWVTRMSYRRKSSRWGKWAVRQRPTTKAARTTDGAMPPLLSWSSPSPPPHLLFLRSPRLNQSHQSVPLPGRSAWRRSSCGSCRHRSWASSWSASGSSGAWCCCTSPSSSGPATRAAPCYGSRFWTSASATSKRWQRRTKASWMVHTLGPWRPMVSLPLSFYAAGMLTCRLSDCFPTRTAACQFWT